MEHSPLTESLRETLSLFDSGVTPWTTTEVAERLDLGRRSTYERLDRLVDQGRLDTKKVGGNGRVWWRPSADADLAWEAAAGSLADDVLDGAEVGVFVLDADYRVAWVNGATERYFGLDRDHVVGQDKRRLVREEIGSRFDDQEAFVETVLDTYDEGTETERFECRVTAGEGREERWLEHRSRPITSGEYAGGRVELYYDVTDRKRAESAHQANRAQFESLVDAVEEYAIFMLDPEGRVRTWNTGAARIKGYETDEILGEHVSTFYTDEEREAGVPGENLAVAAATGSAADEGWRVRADGSRFWATVTITAIRDDDGDLTGYTKVTRDMTDRREREQALRRERDLLEQVQEASPIGIGIFDGDGQPQRVNQRFADLLGRADTDPSDYQLGQQPLRDADGEVIPYPDRPAARALATGESVVDHRVRIDGPDGQTRWLSVNAKPFEGERSGVIVTTTDVTHLKEQARRLQRQRDDLQSELETVFERIDDGFFALDDDLRFTHVNRRASEFLDRPAAELLGEHIWDAFEPGPKAEQFYGEALETQQSITFEEFYEPVETWFENHVYPSDDGISVYFRDVTERKRLEQELRTEKEHFRVALDNSPVVAFRQDTDLRYTWIGNPTEGFSEADVLGKRDDELLPPEATAVVTAPKRRALETGETVREEVTYELADGEVTYDLTVVPVRDESGDVEGITAAAVDITERKERERELEEYRRHFRTLVENFPAGAVALVDRDLRYTTFAGRPEGDTDLTRADIEGELANEVLPPQIADVVVPRYEAALAGEAAEFEAAIDDRVYQFHFLPVRDDSGEVFAATGMSQDVTDQKARERELQTRVRQQAVVTELGQLALEDRDLDALMETASELVAETLGNDYCKVLDLDQDGAELLLREGVGWDDDIVGEATVSAVDDDSQAAHTLASETPVSVDDLDSETRFGGPALLTDHDVRSGISTIIGSRDDPWGILGTHDTEPKQFSERDVTFVQAVANVLATAVDRHEHEQTLTRQREELAALNSLNGVVREIIHAVIEQSTREEIERVVCDRLAASDSYMFAWTGEADAESEMVTLRTEAGVEGYLDDVTISVDPDDERSGGATGRALRTGDVQTTQDVRSNESYEPWRSQVEAHGFRSSAAIPIVHEDTIYGVLNVYADRPRAFEGQERAIIGQLGEIVGHAIAATERKRALLSDEVVELEFRIENVFESLGIETAESGPIRLDHVVPVKDDDYIFFGRTTPDAVETVTAMVDQLPFYTDVTFRDDGDEVAFELQTSEPPVLSVIASLGGSVPEAVIEDGDYRLTVHLAPGADVRQVIETVSETYPDATFLKRRQRTVRDDTGPTVTSELTPRQRTALETAFHAGFFEWPRETSGEDIATLLDVSPPTFHQHLRKAEQKVFGAVLSADGP